MRNHLTNIFSCYSNEKMFLIINYSCPNGAQHNKSSAEPIYFFNNSTHKLKFRIPNFLETNQ